MSGKRILRPLTDVAMAVLLPLLMARHLTGEATHEWMGTAMMCLFLCHHALNHSWYGALFHGRYNAVRVLNTAVSFLLLADLLLMCISGIMMSAHVFSFLNISAGASAARAIHLPGAYWGFILMSFHIGLHWQYVLNRIRTDNRFSHIFSRILVLAVCAYGICAFFRRHFPDYLFLRTQFALFNYNEAFAFYLFDMIAIIILFAALGHYCVKLLTKTGQKSAVSTR